MRSAATSRPTSSCPLRNDVAAGEDLRQGGESAFGLAGAGHPHDEQVHGVAAGLGVTTLLQSSTARFDIVFAGPIVDNTGKELLPAGQKLEQSDLDQFPPGAPGSECKTCMYWWNEGITVELPSLS